MDRWFVSYATYKRDSYYSEKKLTFGHAVVDQHPLIIVGEWEGENVLLHYHKMEPDEIPDNCIDASNYLMFKEL